MSVSRTYCPCKHYTRRPHPSCTACRQSTNMWGVVYYYLFIMWICKRLYTVLPDFKAIPQLMLANVSIEFHCVCFPFFDIQTCLFLSAWKLSLGRGGRHMKPNLVISYGNLSMLMLIRCQHPSVHKSGHFLHKYRLIAGSCVSIQVSLQVTV